MPNLRVIEPANDRFAAAVEHLNYHVLEKLSCYNHDVTHELHNTAKKIAVQMEDSTFSGKDPVLVISFLPELKLASEARGVN